MAKGAIRSSTGQCAWAHPVINALTSCAYWIDSIKVLVDETETGNKVNTNKQLDLQYSNDEMHKWSQDWQMSFNEKKCKH